MLTSTTKNKSVLAKMLACENITVVYDHNAFTASFDVRNRILTLPIMKDMSEELHDMLVAHEVGHALYTPYTEADEKSFKEDGNFAAAVEIGGTEGAEIAKGYLNVIEDARIDRLMRDKFQGLRRDYFVGYGELHAKNFFGDIKDPNALPFIDRVNLHYKVGISVSDYISFNEKEMEIIREIDNAMTFEDVVAATKKAWAYAQEERKDRNKDQINLSDLQVSIGNGANSGTGSTNVISNGNGSANGQNGNGNENNKNGNGNGEKAGSGLHSKENVSKGMMPERASTQQAFDRNIRELTNQDNSFNCSYQTIPEIDVDKVIVDFKQLCLDCSPYAQRYKKEYDTAEQLFIKFRDQSKPVVNILVKQFLMKQAADASRRTLISKSGVIDPVKMMNYHFTEDIFRRNKIVKDGKSHGLVFFIDWSGSMSPVLSDTMKQMFQIVLFCRRMNIPYEVYAFTNHFYDDSTDYSDLPEIFKTEGKIFGNTRPFNYFSLVNILSSRMNNKEFVEMMRNLFVVIGYNEGSIQTQGVLPRRLMLSSTPLNETITAAMNVVPMFKKKNKLDIVHTIFLTDGESTGSYFSSSNRYHDSYLHHKNLTVKIEENNNGTDGLIDMFRRVTGSKAIGIFLDSKRGLSMLAKHKFFGYDDVAFEAAEKMYRDEGFCLGNTKFHKYDELFIIRGNTELEDDDVSNILSTKNTKVAIRNAFIKTMDRKTASRVMLNRFIDLIAKN